MPTFTAAKVALSPLLIWQGRQVRREAPRLPEAEGPRLGLAGMERHSGAMPRLRVLIVGDSSGAGVGAATQDEALAGRLSQALTRRLKAPIAWQLVARTGWTTPDATQALEALASQGRLPPADVMVTALGVNDTVRQTSPRRWLAQLDRLEDCARELAGVHQIVATAVPPMHLFPLLPQPLRWVLGRSAQALDAALMQWTADSGTRAYFELPYDPEHDEVRHLMASDGFHPGPTLYQRWGEALALQIAADYRPLMRPV
ncbi:SGNH/GDSL hydrolase family protein [Sphaerotilus sp.]|uniref:SGNH/GDSL hydrolase family protein n=1 Tax=Sphaerotilus sp. TaxID=2093942 RepID=UPI002ACDBAC7|nr:SGNH/GDSL hydrolase family protein [Sphaerotilus sp.]MDZ7855099.1 SGNH/GDSL hydrolase family protein [Sphaerotilus sp.]